MLPASTPPELSPLSELRHTFLHPPPEARPMMRWWWFGPEVSRTDIDRDLAAMAAAGIGGVEVSYVYPLVEHPARLGSEEFLADLAYAADVAEGLGLRFDVTLGSGWSFGGPHIGRGARRPSTRWERREIGPEPRRSPAVAGLAGRRADRGLPGAGSRQEQPEAYAPLPIGPTGRSRSRPARAPGRVLTATAGSPGRTSRGPRPAPKVRSSTTTSGRRAAPHRARG